MTYYGRFTPAALHYLLKRINGYLVRWARKKYRRLGPFKRAKRWWDGLVARNRPMFAHWQWTGTFQWLRWKERPATHKSARCQLVRPVCWFCY